MAIHINIFSGPGVGKSTSRAGLFYKMKTLGYKVEEISEYAKTLSYGEDTVKLSDQLLVLATQHHNHFVLDKKVDYIITDSPINMGIVYADAENIPLEEYKALAQAIFKRYDNINIFLERNTEAHGYQEYGRNQTLDEAIQKDVQIKNMLTNNYIDFTSIKMGSDAVDKIYEIIKYHEGS